MRVSTNQFSNSLVNQLGQLATRQDRLQTEAATGRRLRKVSDDPVSARRLMDLQAQAGTVAQYQKNIGRLQDASTAGFTSLRAVQKVSNRAGEIATLAGGLKTPESLNAYAAEINKLIHQAAGELNRKQGDGYLFGGTKTDQPPFVVETDANGDITAVTYQGNTAANAAEIAEGVTLAATVPGANTTGDGPKGLASDSRSGADLFNHLIALRNNLRAGDTAAIANTNRAELQNDEAHFLDQLGEFGATQARLESATSSASERSTAIAAESSREGDADLAETLVRITETQTAYQATLQSAAKLMNLSLMDYLR
jgi:flagellar hook-associated protein 3 FlgL